MTATVFVDTNVLIYALDEGDTAKHKAAQRWRTALWKTHRGRTSFHFGDLDIELLQNSLYSAHKRF